MFGSTIYAQTVVLAVFMAGLALGNRIFGGLSDRWRHPVRVYGLLEVAIGIYAFAFPALDRVADFIFVRLGAGIAEHGGALLALKAGLSLALLLGPTVLMGGTLPLLAAEDARLAGALDARRHLAFRVGQQDHRRHPVDRLVEGVPLPALRRLGPQARCRYDLVRAQEVRALPPVEGLRRRAPGLQLPVRRV